MKRIQKYGLIYRSGPQSILVPKNTELLMCEGSLPYASYPSISVYVLTEINMKETVIARLLIIGEGMEMTNEWNALNYLGKIMVEITARPWHVFGYVEN